MSDLEYDDLDWTNQLNEQTAREAVLVLTDILQKMSLLKDPILIPARRPLPGWRYSASLAQEDALTHFRTDVVAMLEKRGVLRRGEYFIRNGPDDLRTHEGFFIEADEHEVRRVKDYLEEHLTGHRPAQGKTRPAARPRSTSAPPIGHAPGQNKIAEPPSVTQERAITAASPPAVTNAPIKLRFWGRVRQKLEDRFVSSLAGWIWTAIAGALSLVFPSVRHLLGGWIHQLIGFFQR